MVVAQRTVCMGVSNACIRDERVLNEAEALQAAGWSVTILAWDREGNAPARSVVRNGVVIERIRFRSAYGGILTPLAIVVWNILLYRRLRKHNATVLHAHDFDTLLPLYFKSRRIRAPLVYDAHEHYSELICDMYPSLWARPVARIIRVIEQSLLRRAEVVLTVSRPIADVFARPDTLILPSCKVPLAVFNDTRVDEVRRRFQLPLGHFIYLYHGGLDSKRSLHAQFQVFSSFPDHTPVTFLILGFTRNVHVEALAKRYGALRHILFRPAVTIDEFHDVIRAVDAVDVSANPALYNFRIGMPNKFFDALSAGKPVLVTRTTQLDTIVQESHVGEVFNYHDANDFLRALLRLWSSPENYRVCSENARQLGLREYNWARRVQELVNRYEGLLTI